MKVDGLVLNRQYWKYKEEFDQAYHKVMESGWYILGEFGKRFEEEFQTYLGSKWCIGVNSGLDALSLAVNALEIGEGDEVLVPANTYIATVLAITNAGAVPVFIEPDRFFNMDPAKLEDKITDKTKAVICVHLYGQTCRMDTIMDIAKQHHLYVIEDCAQAHGAVFQGKKCGTWGDIGCFSFYPTKNVGAFGDSGAIVTNSDILAEKLFCFRNYGSDRKYHYKYEGVNSRMDELQAAFLSVKLKYIEETNDERRRLGRKYSDKLTNPLIEKPDTAAGADHVYHQYVIRTEDRNRLQEYLNTHQIMTQIHYPIPPHLSACYQWLGYKNGDFPITERDAKHILSLPVYTGMTEEEQDYVIDILNRYSI